MARGKPILATADSHFSERRPLLESTSSPGLICFFGLVYLAYGTWLLISARRLRARGVRVPGVITGLVQSRDPDSSTCKPIFRFTTLEGHEVEVTSKFGEASPPQPGDRVSILYDPQKLRHARIDTGGQRGSAMGRILTGFGLLLVTLSVLITLNIV
ncbi:DUF3592 domain-containing protein [Nonomuraea turkmeniaca]|uniref:DUF3592 domain-containing protein n=1 Tax=Nonomuraea turkmeniaca TaxID=103838 RepID=A0A5S4FJ00_9ACTN|nr:DUF3592 domain-containing protein [Nonomuraea turkmeniaca]